MALQAGQPPAPIYENQAATGLGSVGTGEYYQQEHLVNIREVENGWIVTTVSAHSVMGRRQEEHVFNDLSDLASMVKDFLKTGGAPEESSSGSASS